MAQSETSVARETLAKFCVGWGMDLGYGGDPITPQAITFDLPTMYCPPLGSGRQHLRGDCRWMPFICDGAFDWLYSSHLIEDFSYKDLIQLIKEWRRILQPHGVLILNCPDQRRFLAHCAATGQSINEAHQEYDFSLANFRDRVLLFTGDWQIVYEEPDVRPYSWHAVYRKI